ncbi:MAG: hypothetical protein HY721_35035 [Planctomycetes bacterium]|nr:hypothetical protein [Planctomycetota bacterium]
MTSTGCRFAAALLLARGVALLAHDGPGLPAQGEGGIFIRGDADLNRKLDISDAVFSLSYLFLGTVTSQCFDAMDADDDGKLNLTDPVATLTHLFLGTFTIPPPFPAAGIDPTADSFFCDNGRFAALRRIFATSCAQASCHSRAAAKGGLVLEGLLAYGQLVEVPPANEAARARGLLRVKPGYPDKSFLYTKLTGDLGPEEGERMPDVGLPLSADEIELVRHWISDGAVPSTPQDIVLPEPSGGQQVLVPHFAVLPGTEVQRNFYVKLKNPEPLLVTRIEFLYPPGSHHFNLFTSDAISRPDGHFEDTFDGIPFAFWGLRASSQRGRLDWRLPPGVAIKLSPFQQTLSQTHFVNAGPQVSPIGGCACVNLHRADAASVSAVLGTMFLQNKNVLLPPRSETSWDFGVTFTRFRWNDTVKAAAATGHFHWRGKTFEIRLWDGLNKNDDGSPRSGEFERMGVENRIFYSGNWSEPPFVVFGDDGPELPRGWGVVYRTTFVNDTDRVIPFGPHVETEEHANAFLYFYPGPENGETFSFPLPVQQ